MGFAAKKAIGSDGPPETNASISALCCRTKDARVNATATAPAPPSAEELESSSPFPPPLPFRFFLPFLPLSSILGFCNDESEEDEEGDGNKAAFSFQTGRMALACPPPSLDKEDEEVDDDGEEKLMMFFAFLDLERVKTEAPPRNGRR